MTEADSVDKFYKEYHVNLVSLFVVVIIIYIAAFSLLNNVIANTPQAKPFITLVEVFLWILFLLILLLNIKYFSKFDFDFSDWLYTLFGSKKADLEVHVHKPNLPTRDASQNKVETKVETKVVRDISYVHIRDISYVYVRDSSSSLLRDASSSILNAISDSCKKEDVGEVFHIPHNRYTYEQARETCEMFDARLATYDEIEDSYNNGANWCSYGWSSDQLALFPIQKSMYNELKKIPGHQRDCGRTGVNGGYIANKDARFGVNCYGKKPYAGEDDLAYMRKFNFGKAFPQYEQKKKEKEAIMNKILIAPFNKDKWSNL